jgi:multidrug efflux pump subunit AcrA (membrane-fusion protein)
LTDRNGNPAVWVLDSTRERASLRPVKVAGYQGDGSVLVTQGLSDGEQVVTAGSNVLDENMPIVAWSGTTR